VNGIRDITGLGFRKIGIGSRIIGKDQLVALFKITVIQDQDCIIDKRKGLSGFRNSSKLPTLGRQFGQIIPAQDTLLAQHGLAGRIKIRGNLPQQLRQYFLHLRLKSFPGPVK
jgi:hypothetical protein